MTKQAAIEELKRASGSQFDPAIVKILIKKITAEEIKKEAEN